MKRFSITGWGVASPAISTDGSHSSGGFYTDGMDRGKVQARGAAGETNAIQPQTTGGSSWSSWWASSGGDKGATSNDKAQSRDMTKTARWYVEMLRTATDTKLVKHLISLRVHLSTAKLVWIEEFVDLEKGLNVLSDLLASLVGKGGKRKILSEVEATILLEVVKCLRVLLNTEVWY
jgi:hypothetical protein